MPGPRPLILYDISSSLVPPRSFAPNPSKSQLALNFKCVPFETKWVDILDIPDVRIGLGIPVARKFDDGSDYHTLPILQDPTTNKVIGDSFDIANYLEDTYPGMGGNLFPSDSTHTGLDYESPNKDKAFYAPLTSNLGSKNEAYAKFNMHVDTTFSAHVGLVGEFLPFNPKSADAVRALFAKRAHLPSWDHVCIKGEAREQLIAEFEQSLASLAQLYTVHKSGPYLEGSRATYADLIVGGWLNMLSITMPKEEWKAFRSWHGGVFATLHDTLVTALPLSGGMSVGA